MESRVSVTFVGDAASLAQRIEKQQAAIGKLTEKLRQMKTEGRKATQDVGGGLADGTRQALAFAGALTGVGSAAAAVMVIARQLRAEYEALRARQERAANTQVTLAEARTMATLQRPIEMSAEQLEGMVGRISQASGLTQADVWRGLPGPLSAMGSASAQQFESTMTLGARIRARAGQGFDMGAFIGGTLDIMRATGVQDARQGLGFVRQFGTAARMEDVQKQVRTLAPVMVAAREMNVSPEESAELVAFLSQLIADPEGNITGTAAANIVSATMEPIIPRQRIIAGQPKTMYEKPSGETFSERIASMREFWRNASEDARTQFLRKLGGREKTKGALRAFFAMGPEAQREMATIQSRIMPPTATELAGLTDQLLSEIETAPVQTVRLAGQQATERLQILNEQAAMAGEVRNQIDALLRDAPGITDVQRKFILGKFEAASRFGTRNAGAAAVEAIRSAQRTSRLAPYTYRQGPDRFYVTEADTEMRDVRAGPRHPAVRRRVVRSYGGQAGPVVEENPEFQASQAQALITLEAAIRDQTKRLDAPQRTVLVGDERAKQYGGASPHGE